MGCEIADKGFDAGKRVLEPLQQAGKQAVIAPKANRNVQREYDKKLYKARHLIENFFANLKLFRCIATCLRQNCQKLPRRHTPRCFNHLAQWMTRPSGTVASIGLDKVARV